MKKLLIPIIVLSICKIQAQTVKYKIVSDDPSKISSLILIPSVSLKERSDCQSSFNFDLNSSYKINDRILLNGGLSYLFNSQNAMTFYNDSKVEYEAGLSFFVHKTDEKFKARFEHKVGIDLDEVLTGLELTKNVGYALRGGIFGYGQFEYYQNCLYAGISRISIKNSSVSFEDRGVFHKRRIFSTFFDILYLPKNKFPQNNIVDFTSKYANYKTSSSIGMRFGVEFFHMNGIPFSARIDYSILPGATYIFEDSSKQFNLTIGVPIGLL